MDEHMSDTPEPADAIQVTIGVPSGEDGHTILFLVYPDHVHLAEPYAAEMLELSRAVLLDLADALTESLTRSAH